MSKISVNAPRISSSPKNLIPTGLLGSRVFECQAQTSHLFIEANISFTPEKPSIHKGVGSVRVLIEEQFFVTHLSIEGTRIAHFGKFWWVYADICIKCVS